MAHRPAARASTLAAEPSDDGRLARRLAKPELVILAVALLARIALVAQLGSHLLLQPRGALDDAVYTELARRVASGDLALRPDVYFLSPFYTYFLGVVFALTGGSILAARVIQAFLGAVGVWLMMRTASAWFGRRAALVTGVLAALTGLFAFNEILILQSSIDPFLTALALYLLARALRSAEARAFLAAGAALGALTLNRPNVLPCVVAVAVLWLAATRSRQAARAAVALALGAGLLIVPVTLRNRVVAGEWVAVTSHGGLNFYIGNGDGADGAWRPIAGISPAIQGQQRDAKRIAAQSLGRDVSASEASNHFYALAWAWITSHPWDWGGLLVHKLALVLNAADLPLNYSYTYFRKDERSLLPLLFVGPWLVIPLGLFGLVAGGWRRDGRAAYVAWAAFAPVYALTLVAFFVSSRYRLPFLVPLLVGCGGAVSWVRGWTWRPAFWWALAPLVVLFAVTNYPMQINDGRINEREEYIVALIADGRPGQARALLADTERRHPRPDLLYNRVGLVFRQKGDSAEALEFFQRAFAAAPGNATVRLNLGETLLEAGRAGEALPHLAAAARSGSASYTASFDLAEAQLAVGRIEEARAEVARVPVTSEITVAGLVAFADLALRLEDPGSAERFSRAALAREPAHGEAHHLLGVALATQGKPGALDELSISVRIDPTSAQARFHLALALAQAGRSDEARRELQEVLRLRPGDPDAGALLAQLGRDR